MDCPDYTFESNSIFTFDNLYTKLTVDEKSDVNRCGFFRARVINREVPDDEVSLIDLVPDLKLDNQIQRISVPENDGGEEPIEPEPGIYSFNTSECPRKTMQEFRDILVKEKIIAPNSYLLPDPNATKMQPKSSIPIWSTKNAKLKNSPVVNISDNCTDREYIDAFWRSQGDQRSCRYGFIYKCRSIFNDKIKKMNVMRLYNPIESTFEDFQHFGVNRAMLIVAGPHTCFFWHDEELQLAAINYMHWGAPKIWIIIHRESITKFREKLNRAFAPFEKSNCPNPMNHKKYMTNLKWLDDNEIKYSIVSFRFSILAFIILTFLLNSSMFTSRCDKTLENISFSCQEFITADTIWESISAKPPISCVIYGRMCLPVG